MEGIKSDKWFKQDYIPANHDDEEDNIYIDDEAFAIREVQPVCHYQIMIIPYLFFG